MSRARAPTAAWNLVVASLRECADRAAGYGITLAVQNHHDVAVDSAALLELLGDIDRPNVKIGFDAWSPALRGEPLYEAARQLAPHTVITTNADYVRLPRYRYVSEVVNYERVLPDVVRAVPFGDGFIDYRAFFAGLVEGGFDGIANYEMCSPVRGGGELENLDQYARGYLEWMRQYAPRAHCGENRAIEPGIPCCHGPPRRLKRAAAASIIQRAHASGFRGI